MRYVMVLAIALTSCATAPPQTISMVRQITGADTANCEFLGVVEAKDSYAESTAAAQGEVMSELRKKIAGVGGNAYVLVDSRASLTDPFTWNGNVVPGHAEGYASAEAYSCLQQQSASTHTTG